MALTKDSVYFHVNAPLKGIIPIFGGDPVFVRDSGSMLIGQQGILRSFVRTQPRIEIVANPVVGGVPLPSIRLEAAKTNLILYNRDLAQWANTNANTMVTGLADARASNGAISVTSTVNGGFRSFAVVFVGDGTKIVGVVLKKSSAAITTFGVYDNTAAVARHLVNVNWAATGVPTSVTLNAGAGTIHAPIKLTNGFYLFQISVNSVVAANTNQVRVYPAGTATTGSVIFDSSWACDESVASSMPGDTTGSSVTRLVERLYYKGAPPAGVDLIFYLSFIYGFDKDANPYRFMIGDGALANPTVHIRHVVATNEFVITLHNGTTSVNYSIADQSPVKGDLMEVYGLIRTNQNSILAVCKNQGTVFNNGTTGGMPTLPTAWSGSPPRVILNSAGNGSDGSSHYVRCLIANPNDLTQNPETAVPQTMFELRTFRQAPNGEVIANV